MPIKANGQPERPKAFDETLPLRTLRAWLNVCGAEDSKLFLCRHL